MLCTRCLLPAQPAAACLRFKSPEMAEQRKMAVAQAAGLGGWRDCRPACQQAGFSTAECSSEAQGTPG